MATNVCEAWTANKTINPRTGRKITTSGKVYKDLEIECKTKSPLKTNVKTNVKTNKELPLKKICEEFMKNQDVNPETKRKIQKGKSVYNKYMKMCEHTIKTQPPTKSTKSTKVQTPPPTKSTTKSTTKVQTPSPKKDTTHDLVLITKFVLSKFLKKFDVSFNPNLPNHRADEILYSIIHDKYYLDRERAATFIYMITSGKLSDKLSDKTMDTIIDFIFTLVKTDKKSQ